MQSVVPGEIHKRLLTGTRLRLTERRSPDEPDTYVRRCRLSERTARTLRSRRYPGAQLCGDSVADRGPGAATCPMVPGRAVPRMGEARAHAGGPDRRHGRA